MLKCKIVFKGVEYSHQEFKDYVLEKGMGALLSESPSKLALDIVNKYDVYGAEESLDELWARLSIEKRTGERLTDQLLTAAEVAKELNPKGQLTDYAVQEEIRYNTYAGIDLTGISANFGKTFGYAVDATPIKAVKDNKTGETINTDSPEFVALLKEQEVYSAEALLEKDNKYEVVSREALTLNPAYHIKVDGYTVKTLQRESIPELSHQGKSVNAFETIDTVINLAIDNVKEQKLSVLGITGANANVYLTMLGMGIPLSIVSKIFKTPLLLAANENSRWTPKIFTENYVNPLIDEILALPPESLSDAISQYTGSTNIAETFSKTMSEKNIEELFSTLGVRTKILDDVYTGRATEAVKKISDLVTLLNIRKVMPVGEEMFEYAQIFGALRSLPNKKWKVDSIVSKIEKLNSFKDEANKDADIKKALKLELTENFKKDKEYQRLLEEVDERAADRYASVSVAQAIEGDNSKLFGTVKGAIRASFVNRVLRSTVNKTVKGESEVFKNIAVLRIPHVFAAYKTLLQLKSILENSFAVYNPTVQNFIKEIITEANIYTGSDELEKIELISKEFIKFITSNLSFELENQPFTTNVPGSFEYTTKARSLRGKEAWAQKFAEDAIQLVDDPELQTNAFVRALEIPSPDINGMYKVQIIGDKVNDEEVLELIREDFKNLTTDSTEIRPGYTRAQFAQDLFKYSLMGESMYYEKTGFALIFPSHWVVKFGVALDNRLNSVIPKGQSKTDLNLAIVKDGFMFQFLKNNPNLVSKTTRIKPIMQSSTKVADKTQESYAGKDTVAGRTVYFDLKYEKPYRGDAAKYLRRYDDSIYMLIPTPDAPNTYYVKVSEKGNNRFYSFSPEELDLSLDIDALTTGTHPIVSNSQIINSVLQVDYRTHAFEVGETIAAFSKSSAEANTLSYYTVMKVSKQADKVNYGLRYQSQKNITKIDKAVELKNFMTRFIDESLGTCIPVTDLNEFRDVLSKNKRARLLGNEITTLAGAIKLPIKDLPPNLTAEDLTAIEKEIISSIEALDADLTFITDAKILAPLNPYPVTRLRVANALRSKIGFLEPSKELEDENSDKQGALALALKEAELLSWSFENKATINTGGEGIATHSVPLKGEMKKANLIIGDLMGAGNGKYFFISGISKNSDGKTSLDLIEFGAEVFSGIQVSNLTLEEFLKIQESKINC